MQNSNLVLTAETRTRDATEPSGEPETLWNRFGKTKMGDRVQYSKPEGLDEKKVQAKKKCEPPLWKACGTHAFGRVLIIYGFQSTK